MGFRARISWFCFFLIPGAVLAQETTAPSGYLPNRNVETGRFGWSVGFSSGTAIVGAPAGYVDNVGQHSGRAYLFRLVGSQWQEIKELVPSESSSPDSFGLKVAISEDTAVVLGGGRAKIFVFERNFGGTDYWGEAKQISFASPVTDVDIDGDTLIAGVDSSSAAVVFRRNAGGPSNWGPVAVRTFPGARDFGASVAASDDTAVVASSEDVWIFGRDEGAPGGWGEVKTLRVGAPVDVSGDTLVAGRSGRIFERDRGGLDQWGEVARLSTTFPTLSDSFSIDAITVSRNAIVVGSSLAEIDPVGGGGYVPGAAFLFLRDGGGPGQWGLTEGIPGNVAGFQARFGNAVSMWNDTLVVGAFLADWNAEDTGAAFLYTVDTTPRATCGVLTSYSMGTLNLDFTLATHEPLRWELWLSVGSGTFRLWSVSLPAVDPPVMFSYPIAGVPKIGKVGIGSTFTTATNGSLCTDWSVVDTGTP